ncbi:MAG TPA: hypothetical protein VJL80_09725 [Aeromicrobium sp.]|nr:hypothetical protein [Aeromicrobium sp.]HKY58304.1 hypothetical protein [Aeromicrobium sp.]
MAKVNVSHGIGDLKRDLSRIPPTFYREGRKLITEGAKVGNSLAKDNAKRSSGRHGKHYPKAFTADRAKSFVGFGGGVIQAEYGPDSHKRQGDMSFEDGSRNQRPHNDLRKSADVIGPALVGETRMMLDGMFWPGGDK